MVKKDSLIFYDKDTLRSTIKGVVNGTIVFPVSMPYTDPLTGTSGTRIISSPTDYDSTLSLVNNEIGSYPSKTAVQKAIYLAKSLAQLDLEDLAAKKGASVAVDPYKNSFSNKYSATSNINNITNSNPSLSMLDKKYQYSDSNTDFNNSISGLYNKFSSSITQPEKKARSFKAYDLN